jgi:hypothetical protein
MIYKQYEADSCYNCSYLDLWAIKINIAYWYNMKTEITSKEYSGINI